MRFKKKPVVVDAIRLTNPITIETSEGAMQGGAGDWLIMGPRGEQYPCAHEVFVQTYDPADEAAQRCIQEIMSEPTTTQDT